MALGRGEWEADWEEWVGWEGVEWGMGCVCMGCEDGMGGERWGPVSYFGPKKLPDWKGGSQCLRCALHHE